jgi:uncharacterized membrane protein
MADEIPPARVEMLETAVRRLLAEVGDLRTELRALRAIVAPGSVSQPASPRVDPSTAPVSASEPPGPTAGQPSAGADVPLWRRVLDPPDKVARGRPAHPSPPASRRARGEILPAGMTFEDLVGRYGAMALAALAIMSGVGIFLRWAIAQNLIGPEIRVTAGFAAAGALGALGWRFRTHGARTFGNTLMGIALAVVHVVAWGAGPGLGVFPSWLALVIAALASVALAVLAWRTMEESLFVVGVGGALVAPFVTTPGRGNGEALLVFGWVVLTTALYGMRERPWSYARWLLGAAGLVYAGAAMTAAWSSTGALGKEMPAIFALALAWGALLFGGSLHAPALTRAYLVAAIPPLFYNFDAPGVFTPHLVIAGAGTVTVFAALYLREEEGSSWLASALVLPLAFLAAALVTLDDATSVQGALVALGWAIAAAAAGWMMPGRRREALWTVAALASGLAIILAVSENDLQLAVGLAVHAAAVSLIMRRERMGLLLAPAMLGLAGATYAAGLLYDLRPPYAYAPFLTSASLAGVTVVLGWAAFGWNAARTEWEQPLGARERGALGSLGIVAAFLWGHVELSSAFSPDLSTFILIVYYALCGVAAIFVGRRDSRSDLRRVGLALAIFAAFKAVAQAYDLERVGLRVGSFLLVGGFLLAVAYWYRAAGDATQAARDAE